MGWDCMFPIPYTLNPLSFGVLAFGCTVSDFRLNSSVGALAAAG